MAGAEVFDVLQRKRKRERLSESSGTGTSIPKLLLVKNSQCKN